MTKVGPISVDICRRCHTFEVRPCGPKESGDIKEVCFMTLFLKLTGVYEKKEGLNRLKGTIVFDRATETIHADGEDQGTKLFLMSHACRRCEAPSLQARVSSGHCQ